MGIPDLLRIVRESIKHVPSLRYAFGVLGVVSIVAIISALRLDYRVAVFGVLFVLLMSAMILLFSKLSRMGNMHFHLPALYFLWFSLAIAVLVPSLLVSSVFFATPLDLSFFLTQRGQDAGQDGPMDLPGVVPKRHEPDERASEIDLQSFGRIEFIENWNRSLIAGFSKPNEVVIAKAQGLGAFRRVPVNGLPQLIEVSGNRAYVATRYPSAVIVLDLITEQTLASLPLPRHRADFPVAAGILGDAQLPREITSIAVQGDRLWMIAADENNAVIYVVDVEHGQYSVPPVFDDDMAFDARGWVLETIAHRVFAVETDSVPSALHVLTEEEHTEFGGHNCGLVGSATAIWPSASGAVSLITPKNEVVEVEISEGALNPVAQHGNLGSLGADNWIDPVVTVDRGRIYMAVNESTIPSQKMLWSTVVLFENGQKTEMATFFDARATDIAVFLDNVYTIIEDSDGQRKLFSLEI